MWTATPTGTHVSTVKRMASRAEYMREWRRRNQGKANDLAHGLHQTYVNYGCRCEDCRAANRRSKLAHRRARQRLVDAHREEFLRYLALEHARALNDGQVDG